MTASASRSRNLLELMLTVSDNTATDVLTKLAGGPAAVDRLGARPGHRRAAGRPRHGRPDPRFLPVCRRARLPGCARGRPSRPIPSSRTKATSPTAKFDNDPRDTATPAGDGDAARAHLQRQGAEPGQHDACSTKSWSATRPARRASAAVSRRHCRWPRRPGRSAARLNNVGVITLPGDGASFSSRSSSSRARSRSRIASGSSPTSSRALYDYYLFGAAQ